MNLTEQDIELVDAYLAGELKGSTLDAFEERLVGDILFAEEVGMMAALHVGVKRSVLEDKMRMLKAVDNEDLMDYSDSDFNNDLTMDDGQSTIDLHGKGITGDLNIISAVDGRELMVEGEVINGESIEGEEAVVDGWESGVKDESPDDGRKSIAESQRDLAKTGKVRVLYKVLALAASLVVFGVLGSWWMGEVAERERVDQIVNNIEFIESGYSSLKSEENPQTLSNNEIEALQAYNAGKIQLEYRKIKESKVLFQKAYALFSDLLISGKLEYLEFSAFSVIGTRDKDLMTAFYEKHKNELESNLIFTLIKIIN